ncbi:YT521-B-like domain-containing protein [Flagelloscypha sp. PMI_526]|nr:YT521-B-like domain-containing protein [Flagelloscypha sp. PMI_526]
MTSESDHRSPYSLPIRHSNFGSASRQWPQPFAPSPGPSQIYYPPHPYPMAQEYISPETYSGAWLSYFQPSDLDVTAENQLTTDKDNYTSAPVRTPWVLWMGNLPNRVTTSELDRFLKTHEPSPGNIVSSFLISRSNCAFLNLSSKEALEECRDKFNDMQFRDGDTTSQHLVCRERSPEEQERAGVIGQRTAGNHRTWVKVQKQAAGKTSTPHDNLSSPPSVEGDPTGQEMAPITRSPSQPDHTHSSFLARYFPCRYFVLKSRSRSSLEDAIRDETWSTQVHNEVELDRAFRTAKEVYLFFSENKSGAWFGYAKMAGRVWPGSPEVSNTPDNQSDNRSNPPRITTSPRPIVEDSPTARDAFRPGPYRSAPPILGPSYFEVSPAPPPDSPFSFISLPLDTDEKEAIVESQSFSRSGDNSDEFLLRPPSLTEGTSGDTSRDISNSSQSRFGVGPKTVPLTQRAFPITWIETKSIPFSKTKHIRNMWNDNREVKISRDGIEIDPIAGERMIKAWQDSTLDGENQDVPKGKKKKRSRLPRGAAASADG